ncbi:MAG: dehydrogenase [Chloroflexi bacterium RBG_16_50_9]|nr:MAG: dehydrogenase [Chloroflexi bacterium RBG_16_50_9]
MPNEKAVKDTGYETRVRSISFGGTPSGGVTGAVDVKDGRIVRIRPLHYDWKYDWDKIYFWKLHRNGKTFAPTRKSLPGPYSLAYKKRVYSPNRIKCPLKRVDWDPKGERNPQNRGISKYKRISWDEATDIIASEIKRVHKQYGVYGVLAMGDGHGENKLLQGPHGLHKWLLNKMGGYTHHVRNADSWEGWIYGARHVWGPGVFGNYPGDNVFKDVTENSEMILIWGGDPETTPWGFNGQLASRLCFFWTEVGLKQIYICPELNYAAAIHADKWIPVLPNTDAALQLAIIYTWIKEGTYKKDYVATHTVGMDKVEAYVMGKEDGVPKSPEWASPKCGVPEWTIKALAREFAKKRTSIGHFFGGGLIRGPWSSEPARLECIMLGMQGLGGPGVHQHCITWLGQPRSEMPKTYQYDFQKSGQEWTFNDRVMYPLVGSPQKQYFPKTMLHKAILHPPVSWYSASACRATVEDQFVKYTYPIPKEEGGTEVHMMWADSPCMTTCWHEGMKCVEVFQNPKIEFILHQHPWFENDNFCADIILPVSTLYELDDIAGNTGFGVQISDVMLMNQAIKPIGESKSDWEIVCEVARKLGIYDKVTEGKELEDWIKHTFKSMGMPEYIKWEDFKEKQYYPLPTAKDWEQDPPGWRKFYDDPVKNPLPTPTGKLEFYSARLAEHFPNDKERPPIPKWIESGPTHDERLSSQRARKYSLLMMSNHPRWRTHAQCDDISWTREINTCKVKGWDGYMYEPCWLNTKTAADRGIKDGDIVRAYNERGSVLCGARVWERVMPGVIYVDHGARVDWIIPGKLDRGGAINLISPANTVSKNCPGMASSGYLAEVEKVTMVKMGEWRDKYPEAFAREYDPASGPRFNAWVEGGL